MHFNFGYIYLWKYIVCYSNHYEYMYITLYIKALDKLLLHRVTGQLNRKSIADMGGAREGLAGEKKWNKIK